MSEKLLAGLQLMVFGLGMVYIFLIIMIGAMKVLEVALRPFATLLDPPAAAPVKKAAAGSSEDAKLAAVAAAVVAKMLKK